MPYDSNSLESRTLNFVVDQVFAKADQLGIDQLTDAERALYVSFNIDTGIASECSYAIFHLMPQLLPHAVRSLQDVGLPDQAAAFASVLELLPAPEYDQEARLRQVNAIQEKDPDRNEKIQNLDAIFDTDLATEAFHRFIQKHKSEFLPT